MSPAARESPRRGRLGRRDERRRGLRALSPGDRLGRADDLGQPRRRVVADADEFADVEQKPDRVGSRVDRTVEQQIAASRGHGLDERRVGRLEAAGAVGDRQPAARHRLGVGHRPSWPVTSAPEVGSADSPTRTAEWCPTGNTIASAGRSIPAPGHRTAAAASDRRAGERDGERERRVVHDLDDRHPARCRPPTRRVGQRHRRARGDGSRRPASRRPAVGARSARPRGRATGRRRRRTTTASAPGRRRACDPTG